MWEGVKYSFVVYGCLGLHYTIIFWLPDGDFFPRTNLTACHPNTFFFFACLCDSVVAQLKDWLCQIVSADSLSGTGVDSSMVC